MLSGPGVPSRILRVSLSIIAKDSERYALSVIDRLMRRTEQIELFPFSGEFVPEYRNEQIMHMHG